MHLYKWRHRNIIILLLKTFTEEKTNKQTNKNHLVTREDKKWSLSKWDYINKTYQFSSTSAFFTARYFKITWKNLENLEKSRLFDQISWFGFVTMPSIFMTSQQETNYLHGWQTLEVAMKFSWQFTYFVSKRWYKISSCDHICAERRIDGVY